MISEHLQCKRRTRHAGSACLTPRSLGCVSSELPVVRLSKALLSVMLNLGAVVLHQGPLLCALRTRRAEPRCQHLASAETFELEATRDSAETLTGAEALTPAWMADALDRVHAYDYTGIARGQVFVAPSWLPGELLQALQSDVNALQERGLFFQDNERSVAGVHAQDWSSINGELSPCAARAALSRLFEALHLELEAVVGGHVGSAAPPVMRLALLAS